MILTWTRYGMIISEVAQVYRVPSMRYNAVPGKT